MLKTEEVILIEEKWKEFNNRKLFKKIVILFLIAFFMLSVVLSYLIFTDKKELPKNILLSNVAIINDSNARNETAQRTNTTQVSSQNINVIDDNRVKTNNTNAASNRDSDNIISNVNPIKTISPNKTHIAEAPKIPLEQPQEPIKPPEEKKIFIETSDVQNIDTLISKFEATNNILFATMISEEFFDKKNYTKSLEWALRANEINPGNELSWIMFAKNKVKLGNKDDAIRALEGFTSYSKNNTSALGLLQKIKNGEYQ